MKRMLFLVYVLILPISFLAQNQGKFHHILKQSTIDRFGFTLVRKSTTKDTVILKKISGSDTIKTISIIEVAKKQSMKISNSRKCVITLDKTTPTVDFWQITDRINISNDTIINTNTNFNNSTFVLLENRKILATPQSLLKCLLGLGHGELELLLLDIVSKPTAAQ